jgi:hypothetical protein
VGETLNVVDGDAPTAWGYISEHLERSNRRHLRLLVPYSVAMALVRAGHAFARVLLGAQMHLPGILTPRTFAVRFKPFEYPMDHARRVLGWKPPVSFPEAMERIYRTQDYR